VENIKNPIDEIPPMISAPLTAMRSDAGRPLITDRIGPNTNDDARTPNIRASGSIRQPNAKFSTASIASTGSLLVTGSAESLDSGGVSGGANGLSESMLQP
jgi:hypothetical protein